jgi:pyrroline-5-carboxylate reductase
MQHTDMSQSNSHKIAFIGGGNMASSLVGGLIDSGTAASNILVCEPDAASRLRLTADFGINTSADNSDCLAMDIIVLAVKPQVMQQVCTDLAGAINQQTPTFISIAAGIPANAMDAWLGGNHAIVRCMPNTPSLLGCGATGMFANSRVSAASKQAAEAILASVGITVWVDDETLMDAITAVSGSGPAYYFLMMEAMTQAAIELGLDADTAEKLVSQTALGAARMNAENADDAATLRNRVTSPGGTTEQAILSFEQAGYRDMVKAALTAARDRSISLADELSA